MNPDYRIKRVELHTGDESEYPKSSPTAPARPVKDFKKVLSKTQKDGKEDLAAQKRKSPVKPFKEEITAPAHDEEEVVAVAPSKDDEENAADVAAVSLFDLSKKTGAEPKEKGEKISQVEAPVQETSQAKPPSDIFSMASAKKTKSPFPHEFKDVETKKEFSETKYTQEQTDLATVNPFALPTQPQAITAPTGEAKIERAAPLTPAMRDLIEQIVKQMYTVTDTDKTDTVMTIQYPPLFKDARIVLTSFETARGQFNISFENLSQAAQRILDMEENRRSLINALESKGYNVQILTTTTIVEPRLNVDETFAQQQRREEGQGRQGEDQEERKRRRDEA